MTGNCAVIFRYHPFIHWAKSNPEPSGCEDTQRQRTPCCLIYSSPGNRHLFLTRLTGELEPRTAAIKQEEGVQPLSVHRSRRPWSNLRPTHTSQWYHAHVHPWNLDYFLWVFTHFGLSRPKWSGLSEETNSTPFNVDRKPQEQKCSEILQPSACACFAVWGEKRIPIFTSTFFFIFTFLKMACTLQVLANMAPKAVVYPTMRIQVRTCQNNVHKQAQHLKTALEV